jgi:ElaA protein
MREGIAGCDRLFPGQGIRISAQSYLLNFYRALGFVEVGDEYDEDGIPHFENAAHLSANRPKTTR